MIRYNPEIKSYVKSFFILFIITIVLCVGTTFSAINIIKDKVIENNQAIIKIEITSGRSGNFILKYNKEGLDAIELPITIESL